LPQAWVEQPVASGPALTPSVSRAPTPRRTAAAIVPEADPSAEASPRTGAATGAAPAKMPLPADRPGDTVPPPIPAPAVIALARTEEAAQVEAERVEAARIEAERVEAERIEAERIEAARIEAARVEAARVEVARVEAARREAALRAIGRQLDEEAARREAATAAAQPSPSLAPSWSGARRYRLFGRTDPNAELILYAEAWARKIQLNMTFDMVREAAKQPHSDPLVTVAIRSDGSVESVTFVQSSGVAALDEAIRRVVHSQTPYQVFPPGLAREFDVIEIRRTWYIDMAIRLY